MLAKVTRGNQVTIPKAIAMKAHIRNGNDYVDVSYEKGVILIKPVDVEERIPPEALDRFEAKVSKREPGDKTFTSMDEAIKYLRGRQKR